MSGDRDSRWRRIVEESPLATLVLDRDMKVEFWNDAATRMFGYTAAETVGRRFADIVPAGREDESRQLQERLVSGESVVGFETVRTAKDGRPLDVAIYASNFGDLGGGIAVRFVDIRERIASEAHAREEAQRQKLLADFLSASADARDQNHLLDLLCQRAATALQGTCSIYRLTADVRDLEVVALRGEDEGLVGRLQAMFTQRRWRADEGTMGQTLRTGKTVFRPYLDDAARTAYLASLPEDRRAEMASIDMRAICAVPLTVGGEPLGVLSVARFGELAEPFDERDRTFAEELASRVDIGLTRLALQLQRDREARNARILAEFLAGVAEADGSDDAVLERLARAAADQMGDYCAIRLPAADGTETRTRAARDRRLERPECDPAAGIALDARGPVIGEPPAPAGDCPEFAHYLAVPLRLPGNGAAQVVMLRQARSGSYDEADAIFVEDLARRAALALERQRLEHDLRTTSELLATIMRALPVAMWAMDERMQVMFWNPAAERLYGWTADEVLGSVPAFELAGDPESVEAAFEQVRKGRIVEGEAKRVTKSGDLIDVRRLNAPIMDREGKFQGVLAIHEDISERKRLEAQLVQAQKMEVVGRLAGGVAHDFNNILTAILGYSDLAHSMTAEPELQALLDTVKAAAQRAAGLTHQLLAFSRRQVLQPRVVEVNAVILEMEPILRRLIGEDVDLVAAVSPNVGAVLVDPTQLEQVVLNLAVNSRDAMPNGGRLVIRTETARIGVDSPHPELSPGDYVAIVVTDTGTGMDEETRSHIFEPFFTTKEVGKGTGLGLATTYGIVRQSGGHIWVYSEPGLGTTFKLYFPRADRAPSEPAALPQPLPGRRNGRLLVVEDQPELRDLAHAVLTRRGFHVLAAQDPATARRLARDAGRLDLLITDVVMPGGTGIDLARQLRRNQPDLPVLFMSGYSEEVIELAGSPHSSFLSKPFAPDTLLDAVDAAIADGKADASKA